MPLLLMLTSLQNVEVNSLLVVRNINNGLCKPLFILRFFYQAGTLDERNPPIFTLKYIFFSALGWEMRKK